MDKRDAIKHFGSGAEIARFLGLSRQATYKWPDRLPRGIAYELECRTNGALRVNDADYGAPERPQAAA